MDRLIDFSSKVVCAGYLLAAKNLWIAMAKMMYCFDVEMSKVSSKLI